jgi:hypothetical protein
MKTVERGAALLDERLPGWYEKIDLDKLDLASCENCVLGQLHGRKYERLRHRRYYRGLDRLGILDRKAGDFGFTVRGSGRFENLTAEWRRVIKRRRRERQA